MLANFNETMEPLYMLLKEIEDIRLTTDLLDPDIDSRIEQANNVYDGSFATGKWADKKKGLNQPYSNLMMNDIQNFNVKIEDSSTTPQIQNLPKKEQPIWMIESTISGANSFENIPSKNKLMNGNIQNSNVRPILDTLELPSNGEFSTDQAKEILELLLSFEKPNELKWLKIAKIFGFKNEDEFVKMEDDDENDETVFTDGIENVDFFNSLPLVRVNNCLLQMSQIEDDHILLMSEQEKQDYIRIAQQIYSTIFDI